MGLNAFDYEAALESARRRTSTTSFRLPLPLLARLGQLATQLQCTRTQLVILLLEVGCEDLRDRPPKSPEVHDE